ncbi:unnamed protein product [Hermetia illucens]|uniref:Uncharacterized protein n=1 Tax=Hermetia illucens TaxID=343691 RepID=A0A7R8UWJ8_HERIL|nr:general odorant-binding protein 99a-like [Hermetia illucens]CAD7087233.1 unnamed protein product [Hermetia illucens]
MKLLIFLFAIFVLVAADWKPRSREQYNKDGDECFKSENISERAIHGIRKHVFTDESKCFFRCVLMKNNVWDDTTGCNVERVYKEVTHIGLKASKDGLTQCNSDDKKDKDPCQWVNNIVRCVFEHNYIEPNY